MTNKIDVLFLILLLATLVISCSPTITTPTSVPVIMENMTLPTPASTLPELIHNISSDNMAIRLVSIYELKRYGDEAILAIPVLIKNLSVDNVDVRIAAIIALGQLGPSSKSAIPDLVYILQNDLYIHANIATADALGLIGDRSVIPELAIALFAEYPFQSHNVATSCAISIARITGEKFTDYDSITGYTLDSNGVPLVVIDAREWWLETGQYQDWTGTNPLK